MIFLFIFRHHFHHPCYTNSPTRSTAVAYKHLFFYAPLDVAIFIFNLCVSGKRRYVFEPHPFLRPKLEMSAIGNPPLSGRLPDAVQSPFKTRKSLALKPTYAPFKKLDLFGIRGSLKSSCFGMSLFPYGDCNQQLNLHPA